MVDEPETLNEETPSSVPFRAEVKQLLYILAHSLYAEREIFLRELLSNASDALNRVQFEMLTNRDVVDPEAELLITIDVNKDDRTLTIRDTGIGMTRDEMIENLGTIAQSSARAFLQKTGKDQPISSDIIGQFGVGFYSVFMVADRVTVISRSHRPDEPAHQWEATGEDTFTISPSEKQERGTIVQLHLKEDAKEFAEPWRVEQIIKRHSNFVAFPISMGERRINQEQALWRQAPRQVEADKYADFYQQLTLDSEKPLLHVHLSTDVPLDLHAVLFIPSRRE
ncbi:MAG: molecular chaperone HtpG, partial [Chloroflexaceae bacterium]|nr:molecular chaperone HtpG [Chloroflexaceae bacterium]